jgi:DNA mismatch endonuclease (patch repair protein)
MGTASRPAAADAVVRKRMKAQARRDTAPELSIRRRLHAAGVRYRVDTRLENDLRVRGDLVWKGRRLVVFIDGCFWHGCPRHATQPKANHRWWVEKIGANVARDRKHDQELRSRGWRVLRFWEHEKPDEVANRILSELKKLK